MTRLLGQSPSGLSATGESDVRNYYDMIAARQELDLRPQLERLDRLICWSEDIDERALSFAFRPLWQLDEPGKAALALSRAQATQVYAGLKLWPDAVMAKLAEAQLVADGTYPNAAAVFEGMTSKNTRGAQDAFPVRSSFNPDEPRDPDGRWIAAGSNHAPELAAETANSNQESRIKRPEEMQRVRNAKLAFTSSEAQSEIVTSEIGVSKSSKFVLVASDNPPLKRIHPDSTYESDPAAKRSLDYWRKQPTDDIVRDLRDNPREPLTVKRDGRVMNGNTRLKVLQDRGYPIDSLPRTLQPDPFDDDLLFGGGGGRVPPNKPIFE